MSYDFVIRNGTVVDGSGQPAFRADVAVADGVIRAVGRVNERGSRDIDADGLVVTPGFIDGHTHMDAQFFWDPLGSCSCWNGVTTVVMGNCGFTLAPADVSQRHLVVRNLERAEDISGEAMEAGIDWTWSTFRSYLDVVEHLPKAINVAANVGHSALRTWVMGERAFDGAASDDDVAGMEAELRDAMAAGAVGFTTSRTRFHETSDGRPVASRLADWSEVTRLVEVIGELGAGIFEIAGEGPGETNGERLESLQALAVSTRVPMTFGVLEFAEPDQPAYRDVLAMLDTVARQGGRMFGQSHSRELATLSSFRTSLPFDDLPVWNDFRRQPLDEQHHRLRDPEVRAQLVAAAHAGTYPETVTIGKRKPDYDRTRVLLSVRPGSNPTIAQVARERGVDAVEAMLQLAVETNLDQMFQTARINVDLDAVLEIMRHPRNVVTFTDSGAHVSQIMDASVQTNLLAYWVREREAFTLEQAVRMITFAPSLAWGFHDRGLVRTGMVADLNILDIDRLEPELPTVAADLPAGAKRLIQKTAGIEATIVGGQVTMQRGEHTGALPGRLLRGPLAGT